MRITRLAVFLFLVLPWPSLRAQSTPAGAAEVPSQVEPLKLNTPVHGTIASSEKHTYPVHLAAGQYLYLEVQQERVPLAVQLLSPAGKALVQRENSQQDNTVSLSFIAAESGDYSVEVRLDEKFPSAKTYDVKVLQLRPSQPDDQKRVQAEDTVNEGKKLEVQGTGDSRHQAITKFEAALALWTDLNDKVEQANTLSSIGTVYLALGEQHKALDPWNKELVLRRTIGNPNDQGNVLGSIGLVYSLLGDRQKALEYYAEALPKLRATGDRLNEGIIVDHMGSAYFLLGQTQKALDYFLQALPLEHGIGDLSAEAATTGNIGSCYAALGEPQKALDFYHQGLKLEQDAGDLNGQAAALYTIATVYSQIGEWARALESQQKSVALSKAAGNHNAEAVTLNSVGTTYRALGDPEKALQYHQLALPILHEAGLPYETTALSNIGLAYRDLGQLQKALDYYQQALALLEKRGNRRVAAQTLNYMGDASLKLGDTTKALEYWSRALPPLHDAGDRVAEASVLTGIARAQLELGNLDEAQSRLDSALSMTEAIRTSYIGPDMGAFYTASVRDRYELEIDLLMRRHQESEAFEASERARARSLLQLLNESHADIRSGVDPALLEHERLLQASLRAQSERRIRTQNAALEKNIDDLTAEYREVEAQIRSSSPRYAALTQPQPLSRTQIQKQLLDPDTLLLEYALGEKRSFLWAVTPDSFTTYELPSRKEIETVARRAYSDLSTYWTKNSNSNGPLGAAGKLSRMLLTPVAHELGKKRLVIVAEGALQYIPFAALPDLTRQATPLIADHELVSLPSASTLALLRQMEDRKLAPKLVAVLADPVFDRSDPRVQNAGSIHNVSHIVPAKPTEKTIAKLAAKAPEKTNDSEPENLERSAKDFGFPSFDRLLATRREADTILALAGKQNSLEAVDFDASRQIMAGDALSDYRYIHIATHGLLNSRSPELSGLVFSLVDREGNPQNGFLESQDIYNLKLNADLVVLSACQTALGKEIRGEGLVGLTRGFMYAGAPRVVASLWKVPDQATTELMQKFYRGMLQQGLQPAAALRAAQFAMSKEPRHSAPYYWAGFTLLGEWK